MEFLDFMTGLAREAGEITLNEYEKVCADESLIETKATEKDVVTAADKATEQLIVSRLQAAYPDFNVFGEESGHHGDSKSGYLWVIDPIDGTTNYAAGLNDYGISIGLIKSGVPVAGVVYAPRVGEMYAAETGCGAFMNGKKIHVSSRTDLIRSLAITGFGCLRMNLPKNNLKTFCTIAPMVRGIRRFGAASLDLCKVAAGHAEFYWEYPLSLYDVAAGAVIVREAGGTVTDFDGGNEFPQKGILASNTKLHETVRDILLKTDYRS